MKISVKLMGLLLRQLGTGALSAPELSILMVAPGCNLSWPLVDHLLARLDAFENGHPVALGRPHAHERRSAVSLGSPGMAPTGVASAAAAEATGSAEAVGGGAGAGAGAPSFTTHTLSP